ncbi:hypothetical protein, partial [Bradyrhizobium liaoningense]|uniref:hypothetical protein n=1 Tax=Bradyrhizobium liaoningense TaxID=43992 RepID=UPI001BA75CAB
SRKSIDNQQPDAAGFPHQGAIPPLDVEAETKRIGSQALRHCERSEAIQSLSAEGFWIASLRSQ